MSEHATCLVKGSDYIVSFLIDNGVTDVFGIPGGVVLDFLYALDKRNQDITVHLNYHEQSSAYAACGYSQVEGKLGVAYAVRLTNYGPQKPLSASDKHLGAVSPLLHPPLLLRGQN